MLGQPDLNTITPNTGTANVLIPAANTLRGPEGVWIQGNQFFVADSMNNRVLIWNSWPTTNGQPASLVLGQPDFNTQTQGDLTQGTPPATPSNMLNPVSVTSDGVRLFVSDLGQNRVLIWNTIPTVNQAAANVALGQLDLVSNIPDNAFTQNSTTLVETPVMCQVSNGKDTNGNPTYPPVCEYTLNLPRYALSDGTRLFVADGGNDRVLIYEPIPSDPGRRPRLPGERGHWPVRFHFRHHHRQHQRHRECRPYRVRRFDTDPCRAGLGRQRPLRQRGFQPPRSGVHDGLFADADCATQRGQHGGVCGRADQPVSPRPRRAMW